jgi:hypothetical protein
METEGSRSTRRQVERTPSPLRRSAGGRWLASIIVASCLGYGGLVLVAHFAERAEARADGPAAATADWQVRVRPVTGAIGVSDIARDAREHYWVVPDKAVTGELHAIFPIDVPVGADPVLHSDAGIRFRTANGDRDTESLAVLANGFLVGTEQSDDDIGREDLDMVDAGGGNAAWWDTIDIKGPPWSIPHPKGNKGVEALCATSRRVVAVVEQRLDGGDASPLVVYPLPRTAGREPARAQLPHHVKGGKTRISALTCCDTTNPAVTLLFVLEVNPQTHLLRRLRLSDGKVEDTGSPIELDPYYRQAKGAGGSMANVEGIARWGDGGFVMVTDNAMGHDVQGETEVIEWKPVGAKGFASECSD